MKSAGVGNHAFRITCGTGKNEIKTRKIELLNGKRHEHGKITMVSAHERNVLQKRSSDISAFKRAVRCRGLIKQRINRRVRKKLAKCLKDTLGTTVLIEIIVDECDSQSFISLLAYD